MANKRTKDEIIKDGIIQYIMPVKLCDKDKEQDILTKLEESCLIISEYYYDNDNEKYDIGLKKEYLESIKSKEDNKNLLEILKKFQEEEESNLEVALDAERISIKNKGDKKSLFYITPLNKSTMESEKILYDFVDDKNLMNDLGYKKDDLNCKDLLLQPVIILDNENEYFISCKLSMSIDGYALITLEYRLQDVKFEELYNESLGLIYESYKIPVIIIDNKNEFGFSEFEMEMGQEEIIFLYINAIRNILHKNNFDFVIECGDIFTFITLLDYDGKPNNTGDFTKEYKSNICNLLNAPIYKYNELTSKQTSDFFDKSQYTLCKYDEIYVSETTRVIYASIGDRSKYLPEGFNIEELPRVSIQSVVPAIHIVILEKFIHQRIYNLINENFFDLDIEKMDLINDKILESNLILNNLKLFKYDSMNRLVKFIETRQTAGMSKQYIDNAIKEFQVMIKNRKQNIRDEYYRKIGIVAGGISLLLSFTSIYSILEIINRTFVNSNSTNWIFWFTLIFWLILLIGFGVYLFSPFIKNKFFMKRL